MKTWADRLRESMKERGWTVPEMARRSGVSADAINKYIQGVVENPRGSTIADLAEALGVSELWLKVGENAPILSSNPPPAALPVKNDGWTKDIEIRGTAAGGNGEGAFQLSGDTIDYMKRPPTLTGRDVYGLYIENDSMEPRYFPGEPVIVDARRPPKSGDHVIIQIRAGDQIAAYCKRFIRRSGGKVITQQYNPNRNVEFELGAVVAIHRIIPWEEIHIF